MDFKHTRFDLKGIFKDLRQASLETCLPTDRGGPPQEPNFYLVQHVELRVTDTVA